MFAFLAVLAAIIGLVKLDTFHGWAPWLMIAVGLIAMELVWSFAYGFYGRRGQRNVPPQ